MVSEEHKLIPEMVEDYIEAIKGIVDEFSDNKSFSKLNKELQTMIIDKAVTPIYYYDMEWRKDRGLPTKKQISYLFGLLKDNDEVTLEDLLIANKTESILEVPEHVVSEAIIWLLKKNGK